MTLVSCIALCLGFPVVAGVAAASPQDRERPPLDRRSYNLGIIAGFSEVVGAGVKKLALSDALSPAEMAGLIDDAKRIATRYNVRTFLEDDLIVTDLFPDDVAAGKQVLMLFQNPVLDEYRALKAGKARLVDTGAYRGAAREAIARKFGRLLSYSESHIDDLLRRSQRDSGAGCSCDDGARYADSGRGRRSR